MCFNVGIGSVVATMSSSSSSSSSSVKPLDPSSMHSDSDHLLALVKSHPRYLRIGEYDGKVDLRKRLDVVQAMASNKSLTSVELPCCEIDEQVIATLMQSKTITDLTLPEPDLKMCELLAANSRLTSIWIGSAVSLPCLRALAQSSSLTSLRANAQDVSLVDVVRVQLSMSKLMRLRLAVSAGRSTPLIPALFPTTLDHCSGTVG